MRLPSSSVEPGRCRRMRQSSRKLDCRLVAVCTCPATRQIRCSSSLYLHAPLIVGSRRCVSGDTGQDLHKSWGDRMSGGLRNLPASPCSRTCPCLYSCLLLFLPHHVCSRMSRCCTAKLRIFASTIKIMRILGRSKHGGFMDFSGGRHVTNRAAKPHSLHLAMDVDLCGS
jgi:hypothetical protein